MLRAIARLQLRLAGGRRPEFRNFLALLPLQRLSGRAWRGWGYSASPRRRRYVWALVNEQVSPAKAYDILSLKLGFGNAAKQRQRVPTAATPISSASVSRNPDVQRAGYGSAPAAGLGGFHTGAGGGCRNHSGQRRQYRCHAILAGLLGKRRCSR